MEMFNADGSRAEMCGNGVRCVAKYVYDHGICRRSALKIETGAGVLNLDLEIAGELVARVRVDMGEPIKITELARQMIRLAGLRPEKDVEIVYTGLRPGEKLTEELFHDQESLVATRHPGLLLAAPRTTNLELLIRGLDELAERAETGQHQEVLDLLHRLVPEYNPATPKARAAS